VAAAAPEQNNSLIRKNIVSDEPPSTPEHDPLRASLLSSVSSTRSSAPSNVADRIEELKRKTDQLRASSFSQSPIQRAEQEAILKESADKLLAQQQQQQQQEQQQLSSQKDKPRAKVKIPAK
jgi:hypothetical protein